MKSWPPWLDRNIVTTRHQGPHPTSSFYQVNPKPFCIINSSIECPSYSNLGACPSETLTSNSPPQLLDLNVSIHNNPGKRQINRLTLLPMVLDTNTFFSLLSKRSYCNVNTTLQIINNINNRYCQLALIVILRYAAGKLHNQYYALLIMRQIIQKPHHIKPFLANPTNQSNFSGFISTREKKQYIRLTTSLPNN